MNTTYRWFALAVVMALFTIIAFPPSAVTAAEKGNEGKGRYFFKQTCKKCHVKGEPGGEVTPLVKTQAQWTRYFAAGKHNKGTEQLGKYLTPEQLRDAQTFLFNHAADSPQPETCGK